MVVGRYRFIYSTPMGSHYRVNGIFYKIRTFQVQLKRQTSSGFKRCRPSRAHGILIFFLQKFSPSGASHNLIAAGSGMKRDACQRGGGELFSSSLFQVTMTKKDALDNFL